MDIEQLKLVMEMLGAAGEGTFSAFLFYLGYNLLNQLIACVTVFGIAYLVYKLIVKANTPAQFPDNHGH